MINRWIFLKFKLLILSIIVFSSNSYLYAEAVLSRNFYPHITTPARVLNVGAIAFESFPGATSNTTFFANSLSFGVLPGIQVGFTPLFWTFPDHRYNFNTKLGLINKEYFQLGIGYSQFSISLSDIKQINELDGGTTKSPYVDLGFVFTALNYRDPGSLFSYGFNYTRLIAFSNSQLIKDLIREKIQAKNSWAFDIGYQIQSTRVVTFGFGEQLADTFEINSPFAFGYGLSLSLIRSKMWLPRITTGFNYTPSTENIRLLVSFDLK